MQWKSGFLLLTGLVLVTSGCQRFLPPPELRPPVSWDEFATLAEFFCDKASGRSGPSLPPLPADNAALDRLFYTVAASYARRAVRVDESPGPGHAHDVFSFHYDQKTG